MVEPEGVGVVCGVRVEKAGWVCSFIVALEI